MVRHKPEFGMSTDLTMLDKEWSSDLSFDVLYVCFALTPCSSITHNFLVLAGLAFSSLGMSAYNERGG
jgi:hypothetical protein